MASAKRTTAGEKAATRAWCTQNADEGLKATRTCDIDAVAKHNRKQPPKDRGYVTRAEFVARSLTRNTENVNSRYELTARGAASYMTRTGTFATRKAHASRAAAYHHTVNSITHSTTNHAPAPRTAWLCVQDSLARNGRS
jgi:hypothetical protein